MELIGGLFGLFVVVLLLILAIFWLVFPWMVYAKLNGLIAGLKKLEDSQGKMQLILTRIAGHLEMIDKNTSSTDSVPNLAQVAYYYSSDGQQQGPMTVADLKAMRRDGLIHDDTPVIRSGDQQWKTYRDYLALNR